MVLAATEQSAERAVSEGGQKLGFGGAKLKKPTRRSGGDIKEADGQRYLELRAELWRELHVCVINLQKPQRLDGRSNQRSNAG